MVFHVDWLWFTKPVLTAKIRLAALLSCLSKVQKNSGRSVFWKMRCNIWGAWHVCHIHHILFIYLQVSNFICRWYALTSNGKVSSNGYIVCDHLGGVTMGLNGGWDWNRWTPLYHIISPSFQWLKMGLKWYESPLYPYFSMISHDILITLPLYVIICLFPMGFRAPQCQVVAPHSIWPQPTRFHMRAQGISVTLRFH